MDNDNGNDYVMPVHEISFLTQTSTWFGNLKTTEFPMCDVYCANLSHRHSFQSCSANESFVNEILRSFQLCAMHETPRCVLYRVYTIHCYFPHSHLPIAVGMDMRTIESRVRFFFAFFFYFCCV